MDGGNSGMCLHQQIERLLAVFHASAAAACIRPVSKWAAGEARAAPTLEGNWAKSIVPAQSLHFGEN